jgi:hypothetical protein
MWSSAEILIFRNRLHILMFDRYWHIFLLQLVMQPATPLTSTETSACTLGWVAYQCELRQSNYGTGV